MSYESLEVVELGWGEDLIESGGPSHVDEYGIEKYFPDLAIYIYAME